MVAISAYTWKEWNTAATEPLYGIDLNRNFDYVSALVNKGVTGGNVATGGIDAGALIAADIIGETHIDYTDSAAVGLLQIGKKRSAVYGQKLLKGTSLITANTATNTDITVYFSNADVYTAGEAPFTGGLYIGAYVVSSEQPSILIKAQATNSCLINVDLSGTATFTENVTLYWMVLGNV